MLARDHLPAIILGQGPIAIRHVMGCLTQAVPGFSRIPPAKARRLVVAALESRAGGGPSGNIEFEKVGWGRWDAHVKGQKYGYNRTFSDGKMSPPASEPSSYAVSNADTGLLAANIRKSHAHPDMHGRSWTGSSMPSFDEALQDMSMSEHEADDMSLESSDVDTSMSDSADDDTEPEDWAAIGADALRKASIPTAASGGVRRNYNLLCIPGPVNDRRRRSSASARSSMLAKSAPHGYRGGSHHPSSHQVSSSIPEGIPIASGNNGASMDLDQTPQEREAVEALLSMGSI